MFGVCNNNAQKGRNGGGTYQYIDEYEYLYIRINKDSKYERHNYQKSVLESKQENIINCFLIHIIFRTVSVDKKQESY